MCRWSGQTDSSTIHRGARPPLAAQRKAADGRKRASAAQHRHPFDNLSRGRPHRSTCGDRQPLQTIYRQRLRGVDPRFGQCLGQTPADEQLLRFDIGRAAGLMGLQGSSFTCCGILHLPAGALPVQSSSQPGSPHLESMPQRGAGARSLLFVKKKKKRDQRLGTVDARLATVLRPTSACSRATAAYRILKAGP